MRPALRSAWLVVPLLLLACSSDDQHAPPPRPSPTQSAAAAPPATSRPTPAATVPPADVPPLACPAAVPAAGGDLWVPAPPTTATQGRLVPDADPVEMLVCRYQPAGPDGAELDGERLVTTGLDRVRLDLDVPAGARPACPAPPAPVPHLARLTYADGDLWLAAAQGCDGAGNGRFVTAAPVGERLARAFETGTWPSTPDAPAG